jgi:hypothetical protein
MGYLGVGRSSRLGTFTVLCDGVAGLVDSEEEPTFRGWFQQVLGSRDAMSKLSTSRSPQLYHRPMGDNHHMYWIGESIKESVDDNGSILVYFFAGAINDKSTKSLDGIKVMLFSLKNHIRTKYTAEQLTHCLSIPDHDTLSTPGIAPTLQYLLSSSSSFSSSSALTKLDDVRQQVSLVQQQMRSNIGQVIENLQDIKEIENKSEELEQSAALFSTRSTQVRRHMCVKYWRTNCIILLIIAAILIVIIVPAATSS